MKKIIAFFIEGGYDVVIVEELEDSYLCKQNGETFLLYKYELEDFR